MSCSSEDSQQNMTIEEQDNLKAKRTSVTGVRRQHHQTEQTDRMVAALAIAELSSSMSLPVSTFEPVEIRKCRRDEIANDRVVPTNSPIPTGAELTNDWSIHDQDSNSSLKVDRNGSPATVVRHVKPAVMPSRNRQEPNVVKRKLQAGRGASADGSCSPPKLFCKDAAGAEPQENFTSSASPVNQMDYNMETSKEVSMPNDVLSGLQSGRFIRTSAPVLVPEEHHTRLLDIPNASSYKTSESHVPFSSYRHSHPATVPRASVRSEEYKYKHESKGKAFLDDRLENSSMYESHPHLRNLSELIPATVMAGPTIIEIAADRMARSENHGRRHTSFYPQHNFPAMVSQQYAAPPPTSQLYANAAADIHRRLFGDENLPRGAVRRTSPTSAAFNSPGTSPVLHRREVPRPNNRVPEAFHVHYGSLGRSSHRHVGRGALQNMISSMPISFGDSSLPLEWGKTLSLPRNAFSNCNGSSNEPLNLHKYARPSASRGGATIKRSTSFELESIGKGSYGVLGSIREYYEKLGSRKKVDFKNVQQKVDNQSNNSFLPTGLLDGGRTRISRPTNISWTTLADSYKAVESQDARLSNNDIDCDAIDYSTTRRTSSCEPKIDVTTIDNQVNPVKSESLEVDKNDTSDFHLNPPSTIPDSKLPPKKRKFFGYDHSQFSLPNSPVASPPTAASDEPEQIASQTDLETKYLTEKALGRISPYSEPHSYSTAVGSQSVVLRHPRLHPAVIPDEDGDMPIHIAVAQGAHQVVEQLVTVMSELGVPLDSVNNQRQTPLHLAVISDQYSLAKLLLMEGASPNISDRKGRTSVHLAVRQSTIHCLIALLKYSNQRVDIDAMNYEGLTALHIAIQLGNTEAVRLLLSAGANINAADGKNGRTPLYYAAEENRLELAELLLANGAHPALPSYSGCTPLLAATARSHDKMVALLERYGGISDVDRAAFSFKEQKNNIARFAGNKQAKLPSP